MILFILISVALYKLQGGVYAVHVYNSYSKGT